MLARTLFTDLTGRPGHRQNTGLLWLRAKCTPPLRIDILYWVAYLTWYVEA